MKTLFFLYIVLIITLIFPSQSLSQQSKLRYKDVYEVVLKGNKDATYPLLLEFQRQDPFHVNTYFQLGIIAKFWAKDYDPFTDLRNVDFFIYNTKLYFGLAKSKLDEKEARRNRKFYQNAHIVKDSTKIEFEDIKKYIDDQIKEIEEYDKNVHFIVKLYNSSAEHYNECIGIFMNINKNNYKIKDIFLTANEELIKNLKDLSSSYDSTIFFFQEYKTALKNYPVKKYNQNYNIYPIETFRLDGLTSSNFLQDEISLWDFGSWVKEVNAVLNKDIKEIRTRILQTDKEMNTRIENLITSKEFSPSENYKLEDKLVYKIGKFDQNSLLIDLFQYKENKINLLVKLHDPLNNPSGSMKENPLIKRTRFFHEMLQQKLFTDSMNDVMINAITPFGAQKYAEFIQSNYGGLEGLKVYAKNENHFLNTLLDTAFNHYHQCLLRDIGKFADTLVITNKEDKISLNTKPVDLKDSTSSKYITLSSSIDKFGNYYICGYFKGPKNSIQAFVAKTQKTEKIEWLRTLTFIKDAQECGVLLKAYDNGCVAICMSINEQGITNNLLRFDEIGKQLIKKELSAKQIPRYLIFDEINETLLMAFKGSKINTFEDMSGILNLHFLHLTEETKSWSKDILFEGNIVDIIKMDQSYFLFGNFTSLTDQNGKSIISKAGSEKTKTNSFAAILNETGQIEKTIPFLSEKPVLAIRAVKVNSNIINLIGVKSDAIDLIKTPPNRFGPLFYSLINLKGEQFYINLP